MQMHDAMFSETRRSHWWRAPLGNLVALCAVWLAGCFLVGLLAKIAWRIGLIGWNVLP